jgi:hypothetical protein
MHQISTRHYREFYWLFLKLGLNLNGGTPMAEGVRWTSFVIYLFSRADLKLYSIFPKPFTVIIEPTNPLH